MTHTTALLQRNAQLALRKCQCVGFLRPLCVSRTARPWQPAAAAGSLRCRRAVATGASEGQAHQWTQQTWRCSPLARPASPLATVTGRVVSSTLRQVCTTLLSCAKQGYHLLFAHGVQMQVLVLISAERTITESHGRTIWPADGEAAAGVRVNRLQRFAVGH